ncbi:MAG: GGDEF domain-containing protein [Magnetococcales bacterium]|nr:GGDEF domain-containing protein [Magnetococcales bacterium]MBF0155894.1 GGDEF domain-containing protein [Magnetococcales bacterium]
MIEAFSNWLTPYFEHELVAFRHLPRKKMVVVCLGHGPRRQSLVDEARRSLEEGPGDGVEVGSELGKLGLSCRTFVLGTLPDLGRLAVIYRRDPDNEALFLAFMEEILHELRAPLERALAYEELYELARCDALTGLVNRRVFEETLFQEMAKAMRYRSPLVAAALDLDHFKAVNDHLGHAEGDQVLIQVSRTLGRIIRDTDLLARVGGDEFALILPNTELEQATLLTRRLCHAIQALGIQAPGSPPLGVSIGMAAWQEGEGGEAWLARADQALYRAKAEGRNCVSQ